MGQPYAFLKDLLPNNAVLTHVITWQGRDHIVNVRSGCRSQVVVKSLHRTRGRKIQFLESDFHRWRYGKGCLISFLFPHVLKLHNLTRGGEIRPHWVFRTLSRIDRAFIYIPVTGARDFHCYSHAFESLGKRSIPSDHAAVGTCGFQKNLLFGDTRANARIPSLMSTHPVFCSVANRLDDDHQYPADPLGSLADFTFFSKKEKGRLFASSHVRHLAAWEPSC